MADDLQSVEESTFVVEEIDAIVNETVDALLKNQEYDELKVPHWIDEVCEGCVKGLIDLRKPFKYVVTCTIAQKTGAAIQTSVSCFWDTTTDDVHVVKWPPEKHKDFNKSLYCIVTVYGLGL